jgi:hypothetical protein
VLWAMLNAFGAPPALAVVVLGYFVGQVANSIPVPGAVSGGMVGVLLAFGVAPDLALTSVLAYRAIAIWLPTPAGLVALGGLRRTLDRWAAEDIAVNAPAAAPALVVVRVAPLGVPSDGEEARIRRDAPSPARVVPCPERAVAVAA